MSLNDDFFDLDAAVRGTPEEDALNRLWSTFCSLEREVDDLRRERAALLSGASALIGLLKEAHDQTGVTG